MPNNDKFILAIIMPYSIIIIRMARPKNVQQSDKCPATIDHKVDKVNLLEALQLRYINKLTYQQIADKFGVTKQAIEQRLSAFKDKFGDSEEISLYTSNKEALLTIAERELLTDLLDPAKREKATLNNTAYAFERIFNALRLQQGKAGTNLHGIYGLVLQLDRDERKAVKSPEDEVIDV
jgi:predicted DNA-binding protein (UPF0251 family)